MGGLCRISSSGQRPSVLKQFSQGTSGLLVTTPEMLSYDAINLLASMPIPPLFILDEFHLFYIWGGDFRPWIWEVTMGISSLPGSVLGLTATFSEDLQTQWKNDFLRVKDSLFLINLGNHTFKYLPSKIHFFPRLFKRYFHRFFIRELFDNKNRCFLFFCRYRHGVDAWLDFCARHRINALGCKGGEASLFILALKKNPSPQCIFATSALSHGVNLPSISKVFIDHKTKDLNFWIQMAARGGRNGSPWELYSFDPYFTSLPKRCRDVFHIWWRRFDFPVHHRLA